MKREIAIWKVLAGIAAVLLLSSGGAALAQDASGTSPVAPESQGSFTPNRATTYVPVTPCRIFSTTSTGDDFAIGETRTARVNGNLSAQGGQASGCGIPAAAVAIEASVTATFVEGPGYVRAWPSGQSEPQATFVNYTPAGASTSTGALRITPGGANAFTIKNYRSETHIIVDVQGYYVRPAYVMVNPNGSIQGSSRVNSVTRTATGVYQVDFQEDTDTCSRTVSVGRSRTSDPGSSGFASAHITSSPANQVQVITYDVGGNLADRAFLLEVTC